MMKLAMRKFLQNIYLEESLLDDIGIYDVTDDNDDFDNGNVVEYKFSFNFVSNISNVKSVFFDTVIEPVLATLARNGLCCRIGTIASVKIANQIIKHFLTKL